MEIFLERETFIYMHPRSHTYFSDNWLMKCPFGFLFSSKSQLHAFSNQFSSQETQAKVKVFFFKRAAISSKRVPPHELIFIDFAFLLPNKLSAPETLSLKTERRIEEKDGIFASQRGEEEEFKGHKSAGLKEGGCGRAFKKRKCK